MAAALLVVGGDALDGPGLQVLDAEGAQDTLDLGERRVAGEAGAALLVLVAGAAGLAQADRACGELGLVAGADAGGDGELHPGDAEGAALVRCWLTVEAATGSCSAISPAKHARWANKKRRM